MQDQDDLFEKEDFSSDIMVALDEDITSAEERRQSGAKVKKKLNFDKPTSFSLPLLHDHNFGVKPRNSHGAETDAQFVLLNLNCLLNLRKKNMICSKMSKRCGRTHLS